MNPMQVAGWRFYRIIGERAIIVHTDGRFELLPRREAADTVRAYNAGLAEPPAWVRPPQPGTLCGFPIQGSDP